MANGAIVSGIFKKNMNFVTLKFEQSKSVRCSYHFDVE